MNVEIVVEIVNFGCKWTSENSSCSVLIKFVECLNFPMFGMIVTHGAESWTQFNLNTLS